MAAEAGQRPAAGGEGQDPGRAVAEGVPRVVHHAFEREPDAGMWRLCIMMILRVPRGIMSYSPNPRQSRAVGIYVES